MQGEEYPREQGKQQFTPCQAAQFGAVTGQGDGRQDQAGKGQAESGDDQRRGFPLCKADEDRGGRDCQDGSQDG